MLFDMEDNKQANKTIKIINNSNNKSSPGASSFMWTCLSVWISLSAKAFNEHYNLIRAKQWTNKLVFLRMRNRFTGSKFKEHPIVRFWGSCVPPAVFVSLSRSTLRGNKKKKKKFTGHSAMISRTRANALRVLYALCTLLSSWCVQISFLWSLTRPVYYNIW